MRRFEEQGLISLRVFGVDELPAACDELHRMCAAYELLWGGTPSGGLFRLPGTLAFYQRLLKSGLSRGWLHFSTVTLDSRPVSWHFGFLHRGVLHWYKPTYEKTMQLFSPGKVHLALLLQRGFAEGWREFDFGCGTEAYKYLWTDSQRPLRTWQWTTNDLRGRCLRQLREVARAALGVCRRIPYRGHDPHAGIGHSSLDGTAPIQK
jgi:CelD/BcsL family acetyltransferase involved in cellulose biosynthesis